MVLYPSAYKTARESRLPARRPLQSQSPLVSSSPSAHRSFHLSSPAFVTVPTSPVSTPDRGLPPPHTPPLRSVVGTALPPTTATAARPPPPPPPRARRLPRGAGRAHRSIRAPPARPDPSPPPPPVAARGARRPGKRIAVNYPAEFWGRL